MKVALICVLLSLPAFASHRYPTPKHSGTHGGHYVGGVGKNHRNGHYQNGPTLNHYGRHKAGTK